PLHTDAGQRIEFAQRLVEQQQTRFVQQGARQRRTLVIKRVFRLTLRAAQGFIDSIFSLMNVPLRCPDYSCVSRRAKSVNVSFKTPTRGEIAHLVIDSTGLKVFGEGEWKVKKHGQERRRIWRKLHLAVDSKTHEIICADLSL
ncbi:transposase, partial [Klebsiella pneumoniae]|uniref:transposase n=1 Tax=Klebsiella pneumoniae TaxID=573 RepID=UPI0023F8BB7D